MAIVCSMSIDPLGRLVTQVREFFSAMDLNNIKYFDKQKVLIRLIRWPKYTCQGIYIAPGSYIHPLVEIGKFTRINQASHIEKCKIGNFCAIGGRLIVRSHNHCTNYLNMQHYFQKRIMKSNVMVAEQYRDLIHIGHGSWIGDSVIILPGASVGNGAVIGAGSIITKEIPDYAVAAGNPAKVIKFRFPKFVQDFINSMEWWNWSLKKLQKHKALFETDFSKASERDIARLAFVLKKEKERK